MGSFFSGKRKVAGGVPPPVTPLALEKYFLLGHVLDSKNVIIDVVDLKFSLAAVPFSHVFDDLGPLHFVVCGDRLAGDANTADGLQRSQFDVNEKRLGVALFPTDDPGRHLNMRIWNDDCFL